MTGKFSVVCEEFRPMRRNTLMGFATVRIAELRLTIRDVAIHQKGDARWAQLPAKPMIDREGRAITKDNKIQYSSILEFSDRMTRDAFSHAVVAAILDRAPRAFDEEVDA